MAQDKQPIIPSTLIQEVMSDMARKRAVLAQRNFDRRRVVDPSHGVRIQKIGGGKMTEDPWLLSDKARGIEPKPGQ